MAPKELIFGLIIAVLTFFTVMDSVKNPDKKKRGHYRSFKAPVASNAELFDAFSEKPEQKDEHIDNE